MVVPKEMEGLLMDNIDGKLFDSLPAKVQFCILEYIIDSALRQGYAFQVQCLLEVYEYRRTMGFATHVVFVELLSNVGA